MEPQPQKAIVSACRRMGVSAKRRGWASVARRESSRKCAKFYISRTKIAKDRQDNPPVDIYKRAPTSVIQVRLHDVATINLPGHHLIVGPNCRRVVQANNCFWRAIGVVALFPAPLAFRPHRPEGPCGPPFCEPKAR